MFEINVKSEDQYDYEELEKHLSLNETIDIVTSILYDDIKQIKDRKGTNYIFDNYEPFHKDNPQYYNLVTFRRIGMLEMLKHLR